MNGFLGVRPQPNSFLASLGQTISWLGEAVLHYTQPVDARVIQRFYQFGNSFQAGSK